MFSMALEDEGIQQPPTSRQICAKRFVQQPPGGDCNNEDESEAAAVDKNTPKNVLSNHQEPLSLSSLDFTLVKAVVNAINLNSAA